MKLTTNSQKKKINKEWRRRIPGNVKENKMFRRKMNNIRKVEKQICPFIKDRKRELMRRREEVESDRAD